MSGKRYMEMIETMKGVLNKCLEVYECLDADEERDFRDAIKALYEAKRRYESEASMMKVFVNAGVVGVIDTIAKESARGAILDYIAEKEGINGRFYDADNRG